MKWRTVRYLFKEGVLGLWKNRLMAIASIGTIVLCLLILGMSYAMVSNIGYILEQVEKEIGITAYIDQTDDTLNADELKTKIESITHILEVKYISKEEALKIFAGDQENQQLFADFQQDNPMPASFEIKVEGIENQEAVVNELKKISELQITYFEKETDKFIKINQSIQAVSLIVIIFLVSIGLLLITNTIKLTVYVRRKEINIMKYIGATDTFIRLPFIIEGIIIGLIGSIIPIGIIKWAYEYFDEFITPSLGSLLSGMTLVPSGQIVMELIPIFTLIGVGIGALGSGIAIRKHLKV